ncbi:hypothetical protein GU926_10850 [Nibribacter ruber]|uniref:Uncharacterized protein n=1 Tax=Nibribacter ruber TaxID=2698458 RepID=A0A6P1P0M9_9BACT|nr:hypothetical protein [Nibribacter ruber]QHL87901.1 hypothetical protein GU926_10850 [Nibribacter ruber]
MVSCQPSEKAPIPKEESTIVSDSISHKSEAPSKEVVQAATQECSYDNESSSLGIGLVLAPDTFELFNDSLLTDRYLEWDVYSSDAPPKPTCSKYYMPEYAIMHFVCLQQTKAFYKVLVNNNQIKYFPKKKEYEFKTWENYILNGVGIRRATNENGSPANERPLQKNPSETSESIKIPEGHEHFCPLEVNGDWVKVTYNCFYNLERDPYEGEPCQFIDKCANPTTGWLKWREENKILIDIFLMP